MKIHGRSPAKHSDKHEADRREHQRDQRPHEQERAKHDRPEHQQPHYQQGHGPEHVRDANWHEHEQHSRREAWEGHRAKHWEHEHHTWHERGGYRGYRIPEERISARISAVDTGSAFTRSLSSSWQDTPGSSTVVSGSAWLIRGRNTGRRTWYETDEVYVDYVNDGYYMYNRRHPGVAIAINVSL